MAKENKPASAYAQPHTMSNGKISLKNSGYEGGNRYRANDVNMSVGAIQRNDFPEPKSDGIEMRGAGAATKGRMCRGPMA